MGIMAAIDLRVTFTLSIIPGTELQRCHKTVLRPSEGTKICLAAESWELRFCGSQLQLIAESQSARNLATVLQQLRSWVAI